MNLGQQLISNIRFIMKMLETDSDTAIGTHPRTFRERANTFSLCVVLDGNRLKIVLEDLCEWAIYQNQYTQVDVGKSIHKKMELEDVYLAFSGSISHPKYQAQHQKLKQYNFGDVVKNGEILCYKIEKEGFITAYMNYFDRRTQNQMVYQSKLVLNKVKNLDKSEIFLRQSSMEKEKLMQKFNSELAQVNKQKADLMNKVASLEQQNTKIRLEVYDQKQEISRIHDVLNIQKMKMASIIESMEKFENSQAENQMNIISLRTQMKKNSVGAQKQTEKYLGEVRQEMLKLVELFQSERLENLSEIKKLNSELADIRTKMHSMSITGLPQPNSKYFQISKNQLKYIGESGKCTHFIFNEIVPYTSTYSFKVKIVKSPSAWVMIGILDATRQMNMRYSYNSNNAICYYSGGEKYPSAIIEGGGFEEGDIVETCVDLTNKTIKWAINGVTRASLTHKPLGDMFTTFRPFVEVYYKDDIVQWLMS